MLNELSSLTSVQKHLTNDILLLLSISLFIQSLAFNMRRLVPHRREEKTPDFNPF